jgi:protein-tyrosine kinase
LNPFGKKKAKDRLKEYPPSDKSKIIRGIEATDYRAIPPAIEPRSDQDKKETCGWISPVYDQSRTAYLSPFTAAENRCFAALPNAPETEPYKVLRARILQKTEDGGGRAIMVTSALPGEGKTTTAINLALTFAREYAQTVLLVDCDFRNQRIHKMLGIKSDKGLADYLLDNDPVSDLIIWPGIEKLTLISGGRPVKESTELLGSGRMKALVQDLKVRYPDRYVFFDVPAVLSSADAIAFAPFVDYVVVVVSAGSTPLPQVKRALEFFPKEKILGLVLNRDTLKL